MKQGQSVYGAKKLINKVREIQIQTNRPIDNQTIKQIRQTNKTQKNKDKKIKKNNLQYNKIKIHKQEKTTKTANLNDGPKKNEEYFAFCITFSVQSCTAEF